MPEWLHKDMLSRSGPNEKRIKTTPMERVRYQSVLTVVLLGLRKNGMVSDEDSKLVRERSIEIFLNNVATPSGLATYDERGGNGHTTSYIRALHPRDNENIRIEFVMGQDPDGDAIRFVYGDGESSGSIEIRGRRDWNPEEAASGGAVIVGVIGALRSGMESTKAGQGVSTTATPDAQVAPTAP